MQTYATRAEAEAVAREEGQAKFDALAGPGTFFREAFRCTSAEVAAIAATVVPHFAPRVERLLLSTQAGPLERWYLVGWTPPPARPDAHYHAWSGGSHLHPVTEQQVKGGMRDV